jgi:dTDP-4-amino-4,6-dideoxygalactose transaminase
MTRAMRPDYLVFGAPAMGDAEIEEVTSTLRSGWLGTGPRVARFEEEFADYTGATHAVAVNSCTAALHLSLLVAGAGPGTEVITTPMTFVATLNAIMHAGARPVLVDCDRETGLIDPDRIAAAVTPRTRVLLPVHMHGRPCAMDEILEIARDNDLLVVEDAAHAIEAQHGGRRVGTIGDLTCFSFYVTKNITTVEGGMVTTEREDLADRLKVLALHGMSRDAWRRYSDSGYRHYDVVEPGFKYNLTDLQAAIGLKQLPHIEEWLVRREAVWRRYDEAFRDLPVGQPAPVPPDVRHARHLYALLIDRDRCGIDRDTFMDRMHARNIGTGVHYIAAHLHTFYRDSLGYSPRDLPNATWISERTVSIPLSAHLSDDDVNDVIGAAHHAVEVVR